MAQNDHIELFQRRFGRRLDHEERERKKAVRAVKVGAKKARTLRGIKAKTFAKKRLAEKISIKAHVKSQNEKDLPQVAKPIKLEGAIPAYLVDRGQVNRAKVLSNMLKQKRKEKGGKWDVPLPSVRALTDDQMFRILRTGRKKRKAWKRIVRNVCYVSPNFTRKPPAFERFIRPMGMRMRNANVYHPQLKVTTKLSILNVKKNPQSALMSSLGCITKGTVVEVDVGCLGMVTTTGKVIWGKYAQVTNNPELDGCINATLLV